MTLSKLVTRSLAETPVGGRGPTALCDFCNAPLSNGDDVHVLASRHGDDVYVSRVVCDDHDVDPEPEEDHAVHVAAELSTAVADPSVLVLARVREIGAAKYA